jgi:putative hydrolase
MTVLAPFDGDFHVHSTYSDDAVSTIGENIAAARARGLSRVRLIDHVRASTTWVPEFVAAVGRETVPDGLEILTGVETKILTTHGDLDLPSDLVVGPGGVDTVVIADHQFPGPTGPWTPSQARDQLNGGLATIDALDLLVGALVAAMNAVTSGQLAHCFSILPKIGLSEADLSNEQLQRWASSAAATGTLIEINEKWGCPGPRAIRAAIDAGATVVAATDAHVATDVGVYRLVTDIFDDASRK